MLRDYPDAPAAQMQHIVPVLQCVAYLKAYRAQLVYGCGDCQGDGRRGRRIRQLKRHRQQSLDSILPGVKRTVPYNLGCSLCADDFAHVAAAVVELAVSFALKGHCAIMFVDFALRVGWSDAVSAGGEAGSIGRLYRRRQAVSVKLASKELAQAPAILHTFWCPCAQRPARKPSVLLESKEWSQNFTNLA